MSRAQSVTQQLLTFAQRGAPLKKTVPVHKLVRETLSFALHGLKVKYEHHFSPDLWNVEADEGQIGQVIYHLVTNADQAVPEGGTVVLAADNVAHPAPAGCPSGRATMSE